MILHLPWAVDLDRLLLYNFATLIKGLCGIEKKIHFSHTRQDNMRMEDGGWHKPVMSIDLIRWSCRMTCKVHNILQNRYLSLSEEQNENKMLLLIVKWLANVYFQCFWVERWEILKILYENSSTYMKSIFDVIETAASTM